MIDPVEAPTNDPAEYGYDEAKRRAEVQMVDAQRQDDLRWLRRMHAIARREDAHRFGRIIAALESVITLERHLEDEHRLVELAAARAVPATPIEPKGNRNDDY